MNGGFWKSLKKPFFALAPMAGVTDAAFRQVVVICGKPDVMWTEQVSCDGLLSSGKERLLPDLQFSEVERPMVAQLFGSRPKNFYECARIARELGFDGIDINMGCPDRTINKQKAGADLINSPTLAREIIEETMRGAGNLPVSIKTRIGYNSIATEEWIANLLETRPAAITIHGRTKQEMSKTPAHWDEITKAVVLARDTGTLIIGNGDIRDLSDAKNRATETEVDGIMIGRAAIGNPWLFSGNPKPNLTEILRVMLEHARIYDELFGKIKNFSEMKKHFAAYASGFANAAVLRTKLMGAKNMQEAIAIIESYLH